MKLLYCTKCNDVVRLIEDKVRICQCGRTGGTHIDEINAQYFGPCYPIGFANTSFVFALRSQPEEGMGQRFEAFVIPKKCPTMKKVRRKK